VNDIGGAAVASRPALLELTESELQPSPWWNRRAHTDKPGGISTAPRPPWCELGKDGTVEIAREYTTQKSAIRIAASGEATSTTGGINVPRMITVQPFVGDHPVKLERSAVMAHCFLTGVEFPLQQAFVLNRRDAHNLLHALKDHVSCLQRVIEQYSPLDAYETKPPGRVRKGVVPKRHRLVCKAVADVLSSGFPEIELFLSWPEYRSHARRMALHGIHDEAVLGVAAAIPDARNAPAEPTGQEHETRHQP
jgi:hypothetical protein